MVKPLRLQKYLADCGICSRRKGEELIIGGKIKVNGVIATLGMKVTGDEEILLHNQPIKATHTKIAYLVYKPRGYTSTTADHHAEQLVTSLVPDKQRLYPVGRLDKESEGLFILTNDGDLAFKTSHPSSELSKVYKITVDRPMTETVCKNLVEGVIDEEEWLTLDKIELVDDYTIIITLHHGKKRHIRRMLAAFGYRVSSLVRIAIGPLTLDSLQRQQYRILTPSEVATILSLCHKPSSSAL